MIKTDASYKPTLLHEQAIHWIDNLCLGKVQDEILKLIKEKSGKLNDIV